MSKNNYQYSAEDEGDLYNTIQKQQQQQQQQQQRYNGSINNYKAISINGDDGDDGDGVIGGNKGDIGSKVTVSEEEKKIQNRSLNIMVLTVFLQSIGFTLTFPSMLDYLEAEAPQYYDYFGYIVALYSLGQFIGSPIFGKWSNKRPASEPVIISIIISIVGSIFYAITYKFSGFAFPAVLGMARFVVGVGAGNVSVCRAYATETATIDNKTVIMSKMSGAQGAGFVLGPGIGILLGFTKFNIGSMRVDKFTSPGYLSVILAILNIILLALYFRDARDLKKRNQKQNSSEESKGLLGEEEEERVNLDQKLLPIFISIFLFMVVITIFAVFETCLTLMTLQYYNWGVVPNCIVMGASGILSVIIFITISRPFIKKIDDRKTAIFGFSMLLVAILFLVNYNIPIGSHPILPKWQFIIGTVFVSVGYPIASSLVYAIFSKVLNPNSHTQGTKMGWLTAGGSLARMVGPLWSNAIWDATGKQGMQLFFITAAITFIAILVFIIFYKQLSPHPEFKLQNDTLSKNKK